MIYVTKANGQKENFSEDKLRHSIRRAGINPGLEKQVLDHINKKLYDGIPTTEIYHHITEFLGSSPEPYTKTRYSLKQAIMDLGPTGYPFEDYISKLLQKEGYATQTRQLKQGTCVTHEIDVIAEKNTVIPTKIMVEAKFHNTLGIQTNVHVPMYTWARFQDTKDKHGFTEVWVVTNTKATADAIAYAHCMNMGIITWSYPEGKSLRDLVNQYTLFPITSLTSLSQTFKQKLLEQGIVLCEDICKNHSLLDTIDIDHKAKEQVIQEVSFVCNINH